MHMCLYTYTYVSFVLERGGRCNCVPKELSTPVSGGEMKGWFALLMAANNRDRGNYNSYLLSLMISMGADTHATHKGCNALFKAVSTGHQDAMYALLATDKFDPKALFKGELEATGKHVGAHDTLVRRVHDDATAVLILSLNEAILHD